MDPQPRVRRLAGFLWRTGVAACSSLAIACQSEDTPAAAPHVVAVAAGYSSACASTDRGQVYCWGSAEHGRLGLGDRGVGSSCEWPGFNECVASHCCVGDDEQPGAFGPLELGGRAVGIAVGHQHACALMDDGTVRCWGRNNAGSLGLGPDAPNTVGLDESPSQALVELGAEATAIAAGGAHTCALTRQKTLRCWGLGSAGSLGYGNIDNVGDDEHPADAGDVAVGGPVAAVFAGASSTCALLDDGEARCWGNNDFFQAGLSSAWAYGDDETPADLPTIAFDDPIVDLALGEQHTCALTRIGDVRCWGSVRFAGTGDFSHSLDVRTADESPVVELDGPATDIGAGQGHTCAVLETGALQCWGNPVVIGYGSTEFIGDDEVPRDVGAVMVGDDITTIVGGTFVTCAITTLGTLRCWGNGGLGVLGQPDWYGSIGDDEPPSAVGPLHLF